MFYKNYFVKCFYNMIERLIAILQNIQCKTLYQFIYFIYSYFNMRRLVLFNNKLDIIYLYIAKFLQYSKCIQDNYSL